MSGSSLENSRFEAARRGDRRAEKELLDLVSRFARHVMGQVGSNWSAELGWEDLAQDASTQLLTRAIHQYKGQGSEESYVYALVRSTLLMRVRSAGRRRKREEATMPLDPVHRPDPDTGLEVEGILSRLTDTCRDLLNRIFLLEEPTAQVAADLGLAESSVRAKVSRCVRRARELA